MRLRLWSTLKALNLAQRFMLVSLVVLVAGAIGMGQWIAERIENGVIHQSAANTALYVDSFIRPNVEELGQTGVLSPARVSALSTLLRDTPLGQQIVAFKVWDDAGRVLYSTDEGTIGQAFPIHDPLALAWKGQVAASISDLRDAENAPQRASHGRLLEIYSPIRLGNSGRIVAVAEFYQSVDSLEREINASRRQSWLVVGATMLLIYVLLAGFVRRTSDTTQELHERVQRAAAGATALNERFLRRISAELHDGPVQDLGFALLRIDRAIARSEVTAGPDGGQVSCRACEQADHDLGVGQCHSELTDIKSSLQRALGEVRGICRGLALPQLAELSVSDIVRRAARDHERRTNSMVTLTLAAAPDQASLPTKITLYRLVQEALTNAFRHAAGIGQEVGVNYNGYYLSIEIVDRGPGFDIKQVNNWEQHLGLAGMRERVESLGGIFKVVSAPGRGTRVIAHLIVKEQTED